jgi:hypothetical protein
LIAKLYSFDYNVRVIIFTVFAAEQSHTAGMLRSTANYIHPSKYNKKHLAIVHYKLHIHTKYKRVSLIII